MPAYQSPFVLGRQVFSSNIFCSPLAGCSDYPFRKVLSLYKPGLMFCEMVKMEALIRHDPETYRLLEYDGSMHPIGAQLCGSNPKLAGPCAKILEELGFDMIDLNCGCPVDKITKDHSGSGLLKDPRRIGDILLHMVSSVKVPVTAKIRAGWDENSIVGPQVTKIAEEAGAKILFVHGRTREQAYRGPANWDYIKQCKEVAKSILIFGNGDLVDPFSAEKMFAQTQCDGFLLSRGTFGRPWLFNEMSLHFKGERFTPKTGMELRDALLYHWDCILQYQPERKALLDLRRVGPWYLKNGEGVKKMRESLAKASTVEQVRKDIFAFPWEEMEA